jgi:ubiquinone/menaquinone biosynthesis C-methylase UbiE
MDYLAEDGRADHPSHALTTDPIRAEYPSTRCELLDCGVLSGITYRLLKEAGVTVRYTGIDISPSIVAHCRETQPDARWESMSVQDRTFPDDSFDVVNCRHVLECLPYYETAVREAFRVSRRQMVLCLDRVYFCVKRSANP